MSCNYRWTAEEDELLRQQTESVTYKKLVVPPHTLFSTRQRYKQLGLKCKVRAPTSLCGKEHPNTPRAVRTPTRDDLNWAAGFYEGEGCAIYAGQTTQVSATQKEPETILRMQELFGGSVWKRKRGTWEWHASGSRARGFLMTMLPMLSERRVEQAVVALH